MVEVHSAELLVSAGAKVGEGPRWDSRTSRLVWVDILGQLVHHTDPATGTDTTTTFGSAVGAIALRDDGGYVVVTADGLFDMSVDGTTHSEPLVPGFGSTHRPNDALVDPDGALLVGTVGATEPVQPGGLFRIGPDLTRTQLRTDIGLANGIGFSPDGKILYFTDSLEKGVGVFDYDRASGVVGDRRSTIPVESGLPDGLTVDVDGNIWIAQWSAGCVAAYTPEGDLFATVELPLPWVTACTFGGTDLDTLFITTMTPPAGAEITPHAGDLFVCRVPHRGQDGFRFRG